MQGFTVNQGILRKKNVNRGTSIEDFVVDMSRKSCTIMRELLAIKCYYSRQSEL